MVGRLGVWTDRQGQGMIMIMRRRVPGVGWLLAGDDNDHFRRQLVLEGWSGLGQAVAAAHIDHLVTRQGLPSLPLCLRLLLSLQSNLQGRTGGS